MRPTGSKEKNMTIENQVCSLELAKRLKELSVKQESIFMWFTHPKPADLTWGRDCTVSTLSSISEHHISAFTVAELGEMLPAHGRYDDNGRYEIIKDSHNRHSI